MIQYEREKIRSFYAKHGKECHIKASVCWPNKEELEFLKKYEQTFYPSLQKLMEDMAAKRKEKEAEMQAKSAEYLEKLANREKLLAQFYEKMAALRKEEEEERIRQEKVVAEVREYLGFNIEQTDSRFQEALAKKEEDDRKAAKLANKKDKKTKVAMMLEELLGVDKTEVLVTRTRPGTQTKPGTDTISDPEKKENQ